MHLHTIQCSPPRAIILTALPEIASAKYVRNNTTAPHRSYYVNKERTAYKAGFRQDAYPSRRERASGHRRNLLPRTWPVIHQSSNTRCRSWVGYSSVNGERVGAVPLSA